MRRDQPNTLHCSKDHEALNHVRGLQYVWPCPSEASPSIPLVGDPPTVVGLCDQIPHGVERWLVGVLPRKGQGGQPSEAITSLRRKQ